MVIWARLILVTVLVLGPNAVGARSLSSVATLEVVLDHPGRTIVEKEMVLATIRGTYGVTIARETLTIPRMGGVDWIQLGRDAWSRQTVGGRQVDVMERRVAFFPRRAGTVKIAPIRHTLTLAEPNGRRSVREVHSSPIALAVRPAPRTGEWWLPAAAVEMTDTWSKPPGALAYTETVTRRVTIWALGATPEMLPPQPPMREPWLVTFVSPERRTSELTPAGPLSTVTWEWTFNPITGEPGVLPEVAIPWFDTGARASRTVLLPAAPIARAGLGTNTAAVWRESVGGRFALVFSGLLGVFAVLAVGLPGRRIRSARECRRWLRAVWPQPGLRALHRAARSGNAALVRAAAVRVLDDAHAPPAVRRSVLEPLDRHLFGPPPAPGIDLRACASQVKRTVAALSTDPKRRGRGV